MIKYQTIISFLIVSTSCGADIQTNESDLSSNPDTIVYWFPENEESKTQEANLKINDKNYMVEYTVYTLNSDVEFNHENETEYFIYHYRDYAADIKISKNDSTVFSKKITKEDLRTNISNDLIKIGTLGVEFKGCEKDHFFFNFAVSKPETDWVVFLKYFIDTTGTVRTEEYPESFYKME
jgi:hypothetical protein